jgi:tetratricopeptide (TPR) repeat protein
MTMEGTTRLERAERWHLADERDFLRRSLQDADREHAAGDLSDEDHALLVARDSARLAEVEAELAQRQTELDSADDASADAGDDAGPTAASEVSSPSKAWPWWRRLGVVVAALLIAVGLVVLVSHAVRSRQPGQAPSGSVTQSQFQQIEEELQQALPLNSTNPKAALEIYDKVLAQDPSDPAALSYAGFLEWNLGSTQHVPDLVRLGRAEVEKAVRVSPSYFQGHLFYGLILENQDHDAAAAVSQFGHFLADDPPAAELAQAAPLVAGAYQAAGKPLPAAFHRTAAAGS